MDKKYKVGILGGTFNPIHNGHVALAKAVYEYCGLDEVWLMPSGVSYMKDKSQIADAKHRFKMVEEAIGGYPYLKVSDLEICREGNTYTADTLQEVHKRYPQTDFYFIMGADALFSLPKWKKPEEIARLCTIAVVCRDEMDKTALQQQKSFLQQTYGANVVLVPFFKIEISSSKIRECLKMGQSVTGLLPEKVSAYIQRNGLYKR